MSMFSGLNASASALTAQRLRMDVVASNIANADSTRATLNDDGTFDPYRRKMVSVGPKDSTFQSYLHKASQSKAGSQGVKVTEIQEDDTPFKMIYNPGHPDSNPEGYVQKPNVDPLKEMTDMMGATRSYEANITALNASKNMLMKALEIGK